MGAIRRRSGNAVTEYCEMIGYAPENIIMVGVGLNHGEVDCFREKFPSVDITGLEAVPSTYRKIRDSFPGVLINVGVGDCEESRKVYSKKRHADASSIFDREDVKTSSSDVDFSTLDILFRPEIEYFRNFGGRESSLLWLDCEGSELKALQGGLEFLHLVDMINVEMTGKPRMEGFPSPLEIHKFLSLSGFYPVWNHTNRCCIGQYDCIYIRKSLFDERFCSHPETTEKLKKK